MLSRKSAAPASSGTIRRRDFWNVGRMQESTSSRISRLRMLRRFIERALHRKELCCNERPLTAMTAMICRFLCHRLRGNKYEWLRKTPKSSSMQNWPGRGLQDIDADSQRRSMRFAIETSAADIRGRSAAAKLSTRRSAGNGGCPRLFSVSGSCVEPDNCDRQILLLPDERISPAISGKRCWQTGWRKKKDWDRAGRCSARLLRAGSKQAHHRYIDLPSEDREGFLPFCTV